MALADELLPIAEVGAVLGVAYLALRGLSSAAGNLCLLGHGPACPPGSAGSTSGADRAPGYNPPGSGLDTPIGTIGAPGIPNPEGPGGGDCGKYAPAPGTVIGSQLFMAVDSVLSTNSYLQTGYIGADAKHHDTNQTYRVQPYSFTDPLTGNPITGFYVAPVCNS